MSYLALRTNIFDCAVCPTRCDGKSVGQYDFERDVAFSEGIENEIIRAINDHYPHLIATQSTRNGYPDIELCRRVATEHRIAFAEVKVQSRTFMAIERYLPNSGLYPSETLALNLSDLERYFAIKQTEQKPIYLVWCLMSRPCVLTGKKRQFYYQEIDVLQRIYQKEKNKRRFRRDTGIGDVVDGVHKGVTVNYHFSLNELIEGLKFLS